MRLIELLRFSTIHVPWPLHVEGTTIDGHNMKLSPLCSKRCGQSPRCASTKVVGENVCLYGMSFYRANVGGADVTFFGIRGPNNPNTSHPTLKPLLKGRSVSESDVRDWTEGVSGVLAAIEQEFLKRQSEMLDPLHDPIRLARQVQTIAQRLVASRSVGASFDEQVESAPPDLKSLVKASELLSDSFDLLNIYFNPASASYGKKTYISLHGLLRKLAKIFSTHENVEGDEPVRIFLNGSSFRSILVFESFKLLPFALISNAVKYNLTGPIRIEIIERQGGIEVSVESHGPPIDSDEMEKIFERRGRGRWAEKLSPGSGVGLYLSKIVAEANGFYIKVSSVRQAVKPIGGVPVATNRFTFGVSI